MGSKQRTAHTNLNPGKYVFQVQGSNSDGVWNEAGVSLQILITPPWWNTILFRAVCAAVLLAVIWAAYRLRVRQLHHEFDMTLEARVGERTRIARDLHDTLLQSFHGLLLRFQTVSQLLPERPVEAKEKLDSAIEQAADAITEGRDAVQGLRASILEANDLAQAVNTLGEELAGESAGNAVVGFRVAVEGEARDLHSISTTSGTSLPNRCGTLFGTPEESKSRLECATTMSNSVCVCETTEKGLIERCFLAMEFRDTTACTACGNAP